MAKNCNPAATRLTPATARAIQPGQIIRDHDVKGLHLRGTSTGGSWCLWYRTQDGKPRRPKLGDFPALNIDRARAAARDVLQAVARGADPSAEWRAGRDAPTVAELCSEYLVSAEFAKLAPATQAKNKSHILVHIRPKLGRCRVQDVRPVDVQRMLDTIDQPPVCNDVRATCRRLFYLASRWGSRTGPNPVLDTSRKPQHQRRRYATGAELLRLGEALRELQAEHPRAVAAIMTLFLTGARVSEILRARSDQRRGNRLVLSEHKTAKHIGSKSIILPDAVCRLLDAMPPHKSGRLFGVANGQVLWRQLRARAGLGDLQLRDARRTFATIALSRGVSLAQIGELLHHTKAQTTMIYAKLLDDARESIASDVASAVSSAAGFSLPGPSEPAEPQPRLLRLRRRALAPKGQARRD